MRRFHTFVSLYRGFASAMSVPTFRALLGLTLTLVFVAAVFYSWVEGWSALDATYFAVVTIATVGYGDLAPQTALGKIFTIGYVFAGIGIFVAAATALGQHVIRQETENDR